MCAGSGSTLQFVRSAQLALQFSQLNLSHEDNYICRNFDVLNGVKLRVRIEYGCI